MSRGEGGNRRSRVVLLCGTLVTTVAFLFHFKGLKTSDLSEMVTITNITAAAHHSTPTLPESCREYVKDHALSLQHGRYIHVSNRRAPYDHNSCFLLKPRYNCATSNPAKPKPHEWKFILQSNLSDDSTICDIQEVVDDLGGPRAITETKQLALFGNSFLRQVFEAMACKYQNQLTKALVMENAPSTSLAANAARKGKRLQKNDFMNSYIISLPLDKRPIPHCSGIAEDYGAFFEDGVNLTAPHYTESCSDDLAMMEYNGNVRISFNFHPERIHNTAHFYQEMIGLNVSELHHVAFNGNSFQYFRSQNLGQQARWVAWRGVLPRLKQFQRRDAGRWFGANNPWITNPPDMHPCIPGIPDDEVSLFLFSIIFDIRQFTY